MRTAPPARRTTAAPATARGACVHDVQRACTVTNAALSTSAPCSIEERRLRRRLAGHDQRCPSRSAGTNLADRHTRAAGSSEGVAVPVGRTASTSSSRATTRRRDTSAGHQRGRRHQPSRWRGLTPPARRHQHARRTVTHWRSTTTTSAAPHRRTETASGWAAPAAAASSAVSRWARCGGDGPTQLGTTPSKRRWPHIFAGQLYATSNQTQLLERVHRSAPACRSDARSPGAPRHGMPTSNASPFSFVFFDRKSTVGRRPTPCTSPTTAPGRAASPTRGIQKWTRA